MMKKSVTDFSKEKKNLKGTPSSHHWQILFPTETLKNSITPSRKLFPKGGGGQEEGGGGALEFSFFKGKFSLGF